MPRQIMMRRFYGFYPIICVNSKAVQNDRSLRVGGQRIYPMSACVHHSMPGERSQGRFEASFIAAPKGAQTLDAIRPACYSPASFSAGQDGR